MVMARAEGVPGPAAVAAGKGLGVLRGMVDGLEEVHKAGIVHLDLRLENVVVGNRVAIVDFGSCEMEAAPGRDYTKGSVVEALAPEVMVGGNVSVGADVWALGVAAYRVVCGRGPWSGGDYRVMEAVGRRESFGELNFGSGVGKEARDFVQRCLEPRVGERLGVREVDRKVEIDYEEIRRHPFLNGVETELIGNGCC